MQETGAAHDSSNTAAARTRRIYLNIFPISKFIKIKTDSRELRAIPKSGNSPPPLGERHRQPDARKGAGHGETGGNDVSACKNEHAEEKSLRTPENASTGASAADARGGEIF